MIKLLRLRIHNRLKTHSSTIHKTSITKLLDGIASVNSGPLNGGVHNDQLTVASQAPILYRLVALEWRVKLVQGFFVMFACREQEGVEQSLAHPFSGNALRSTGD
jgi:hypothetical protein